MTEKSRYAELGETKVDNFGRIQLGQLGRQMLAAPPYTILRLRWDRIANQLVISNPDLEPVRHEDGE